MELYKRMCLKDPGPRDPGFAPELECPDKLVSISDDGKLIQVACPHHVEHRFLL
jgi:hypothetical protein